MARLRFPAKSPELEAIGAALVPAVDKPGQGQVPSGQGGAPAGPTTRVVTKPAGTLHGTGQVKLSRGLGQLDSSCLSVLTQMPPRPYPWAQRWEGTQVPGDSSLWGTCFGWFRAAKLETDQSLFVWFPKVGHCHLPYSSLTWPCKYGGVRRKAQFSTHFPVA